MAWPKTFQQNFDGSAIVECAAFNPNSAQVGSTVKEILNNFVIIAR